MRPSVLEWKKNVARRRRFRVRKKIVGSAEQPRLVFRKTLRHLYAQLVDDRAGKALAHVTTDTKANRASGRKSFRNVASAKTLGQSLGAQLKEKGIASVVFDRAGHPYHGVVKAFADAVREQGIKF
jgi:large subunit ribosomal protein L18